MAEYHRFGISTKVQIFGFHKAIEGMTGTVLGFHIDSDCPEGKEEDPEWIWAIVLYDEPSDDMALASCIPLECLEPVVTN
jgi:hypothetical protein